MPTPVFISTDGVRDLARAVSTAAGGADALRTTLLSWLVTASLDDAATAELLARIDDELVLLAAVLEARALLAAYPMRDVVSATLSADVQAADRALAELLGPDPTRVADGRRAAQELRDGGAEPDEALLRRIGDGAADPSFALGFVDELSLDGAAAAVVRSSSAHPDLTYLGGSTPETRAAWGARHRLVLDALGQVLAAASVGEGRLASAAGDADAWVAAITVAPEDSAYTGEGAALALLLAHGHVNADVLAGLADGAYRYERATAVDSQPLWRPRAFAGGSPGGPRSADGRYQFDPLAPILVALGAQPAAAQSFFAAADAVVHDVEGAPQELNERLVYLFEQRVWPVDDGGGFGAALTAATTSVRDRTDAGRLSAQLASQALAIVGGRTGDGEGGVLIFHHDGWFAPAGTRQALADIVVSYMPDVFSAVQADGVVPAGTPWHRDSPPGFPPAGPYGLVVSRPLLATVVETIGTDPERARQLLAAVLGTQQLRLGYAIDVLAAENPNLAADLNTQAGGGERTSLVVLDNAVIEGSSTLGFLVQHAFVGDRDAQARAAAAQQQWADLLGVALKLPVVPTPAGPWGKLVLSQATTRLFDAWKSSVPSDATAAYQDIDLVIEARMEQLVLDELAARGLLHPAEPIVGYESPPDAAFVLGADGRPRRPLRFDPAGDAFAAWSARYAPSSWINVQVVVPYLAAFPRVG